MKYFKTPDYVYATSLSGSTGRLDVSEALLSRFSFLCFGCFFSGISSQNVYQNKGKFCPAVTEDITFSSVSLYFF